VTIGIETAWATAANGTSGMMASATRQSYWPVSIDVTVHDATRPPDLLRRTLPIVSLRPLLQLTHDTPYWPAALPLAQDIVTHWGEWRDGVPRR